MSILAKMGSWLFGGGGAEKVAEVADEAFHTGQERAQEDAADLKDARQFAGVSGSHGLINQVVDSANRLIRPGVTVWLIGGFVGWWALPSSDAVSEFWQNIFMLVVTFWFGGRAILKDLPQAIRMMRGGR